MNECVAEAQMAYLNGGMLRKWVLGECALDYPNGCANGQMRERRRKCLPILMRGIIRSGFGVVSKDGRGSAPVASLKEYYL